MTLRFKKPGTKKKKAVGKAKAEKTSTDPTVSDAEKAVEIYEESYGLLEEMREAFAEDYPEANKALESIKLQEDDVREAIKTAHYKVQAAKTTIGPFKCQRKFSAAGYSQDKFTKICSELEDPSVIVELISAGAIKAIVPDNGTRKSAGRAVTFIAQHPDLADVFLDAWVDEAEKTPAVTDPKI